MYLCAPNWCEWLCNFVDAFFINKTFVVSLVFYWMFLRWRESSEIMHLKYCSWFPQLQSKWQSDFLLCCAQVGVSLNRLWLHLSFWDDCVSNSMDNKPIVLTKENTLEKAILKHYCFPDLAIVLSPCFKSPYSSLVLERLVFLSAVL